MLMTSFLYDHSKPSPTAVDHREHVTGFQVVDPNPRQHGLFLMPTHWKVERQLVDGQTQILESSK